LFAAPYLSLADVNHAVAELRVALKRDCRVAVATIGPVITVNGPRSPGDRIFDPLWALAAEAGVVICFHAGDSRYTDYVRDWGQSAEMEGFRQNPLKTLLSPSAVQDTFASLIVGGVFERFPALRTASIENGSDWVAHLFARMSKSFGMTPHAYAEDPRETFRQHVWVAPFYEDDLRSLRDLIGTEHILMGSDWPHAEGLDDPISFANDLRANGFEDHECRLVMRDNALSLTADRQPPAP
jgi:predicted TIM-barrel fold metal-dependent hydrolase